MLNIDFGKIDGFDEDQLKLLNGNAVQEAIKNGIDNYVKVAKDEFKSKMNALDDKLKAATTELDKYSGIDPDKVKALESSAKGKDELEATLAAIKDKYTQAEKALEQKSLQLQELALNNIINETISQFNTKNPTVAVRDDARDLVAMLAKQSFREQDGAFVPHNPDGSAMATENGFATPVDWLKKLRSEKPLFFNAPTGSGASGSNGTGSASDWAIYFKPGSINLTKQAELQKTDPDLYDKLKRQ